MLSSHPPEDNMPDANHSPSAQRFLDLALQVSRADSSEKFYDSLRKGYLGVHALLTNDADGHEAQALREAFEASQANLAQRLALQLCVMPLYEKPGLPTDEGAPPEFLWMFALPVVIRFTQQLTDKGNFVWPEDVLPANELLALLHDGNRLEPRAQLGMFTPLYTRNDLLAWGPENMAFHAVNAELMGTPAPAPLPVNLSADRPASRSMLFFGVGLARVPVGVKSLLRRQDDERDLSAMTALIASRLAELGVSVEAVTVCPPCPITSSCFMANPAYLGQVYENCLSAKEELGAVSAQVRFPMPGYLEISALTASGKELSLLPAEPCCEPPGVVITLLEHELRRAGLKVETAPPTYIFSATMLQ
jgi:hypothetical protein